LIGVPDPLTARSGIVAEGLNVRQTEALAHEEGVPERKPQKARSGGARSGSGQRSRSGDGHVSDRARSADALFRAQRVRILTCRHHWRPSALAFRHAFHAPALVCDVEPSATDALRGRQRVGTPIKRGRWPRQFAFDIGLPSAAVWSAASCWRRGCGSCRRSGDVSWLV